MALRHSVDVANDVLGLMRYTDYVAQIILKPGVTYVKVGDVKKRTAVLVNVDLHRKPTYNWLQDKIVAIKLAAKLTYNLRKT